MTQWTARQVAGFWEAAGGPARRAVEWVAIALGESSYDDAAVSSAGAIGLWQIMPFNAGPYGYSVTQLYDPQVNASVAVQMSGHGANCAAWDSAYADIQASGRYSFLAWPEQGSADFNNLAIVAAQLGQDKINPPPRQPIPTSPGSDLTRLFAQIAEVQNKVMPSLRRVLIGQGIILQRQFRPGWRP